MASPTLTRRQRRAFAGFTIVFALAAAATTTLLLDIYTHRRQATRIAINIWGYRGPVAGRKQRDERRIVIIGGSTVFGWMYSWQQAFPALLERDLRGRVPTPVSVVNLGFPQENAYAYRAVFEDYLYLDPDLVVFYGERNTFSTPAEIRRHESAVFRLTGYYPLLPTAMREKAMALRHGDVATGYANGPPATDASIFRRAEASILGAAWAAAESLSHRVTWLGRRAPESPVSDPTCAAPWQAYCDAMYRAIVAVRDRRTSVLVVTQPSGYDRQFDQERALHTMLTTRFGGDRQVHYLDLSRAIDVHDRELALDPIHLTDVGNRRIADRLRDYVQPLLWSELPHASPVP